MRIIYHCVWDYSEEDELFMNNNSIPFKYLQGKSSSYFVVDIDSKNVFCEEVLKRASSETYIRFIEYTTEDLSSAEYLTMRARIHSIDLAREDDLFESWERIDQWRSWHIRLKTNQFYVKRPIKWGKKHFIASFDLGETYLFCDDKAKDVLEKVEGLTILPVRHPRTENIMDNIHYVEVNNVLPLACIDPSHEKERKCPVCGDVSWLVGSDHVLYLYRKELPQNLTFARTQDVFGSGGNIKYPLNVISHEMYEVLCQHNLTNNLVFEPVVLTE